MSAKAKRTPLKRRIAASKRSLESPHDRVVEQFVTILRRCGYFPMDIVGAVLAACRKPIPPIDAQTEAREFREAPHIMSVWHTDPEYTDARGRPRSLSLKGPAPSLELLVRRVNRARRVDDMAQYLLRAGAIEKAGKRYVARTRWVSLRGMRETSARVLRGVRGILMNYEHNLLPREQAEGWFEYTAENYRFPRSQEGALADFYQRDCMASLRRVDAFMLRCEQERKPEEPTMHVGFGMYRYHDEDPALQAHSGPSPRSRRARPRLRRKRAAKGGSRDRSA